jgi:hypothetical protein
MPSSAVRTTEACSISHHGRQRQPAVVLSVTPPTSAVRRRRCARPVASDTAVVRPDVDEGHRRTLAFLRNAERAPVAGVRCRWACWIRNPASAAARPEVGAVPITCLFARAPAPVAQTTLSRAGPAIESPPLVSVSARS